LKKTQKTNLRKIVFNNTPLNKESEVLYQDIIQKSKDTLEEIEIISFDKLPIEALFGSNLIKKVSFGLYYNMVAPKFDIIESFENLEELTMYTSENIRIEAFPKLIHLELKLN
jgi:hypothetical protein